MVAVRNSAPMERSFLLIGSLSRFFPLQDKCPMGALPCFYVSFILGTRFISGIFAPLHPPFVPHCPALLTWFSAGR